MNYGICNLSAVPGRSDESDRSEMVTQLLFGDHFQIIDEQKKWIYIRTGFDNYECWIDKKQYQPVSEETYNELQDAALFVATDLVQVLEQKETHSVIPVLMGSTLPNYDGEVCNLEGVEYTYDGAFLRTREFNSEELVENAMAYLNAPYLWGGRSPFGIDCSGLTQMVYKMSGIRIPRDAYQQAEVGETLSFLEEANPGDLAFFDNEAGRIIHVGIVIPGSKILHGSGKVRIDSLDHNGIYNHETGSYTHNLRILKRIAQ